LGWDAEAHDAVRFFNDAWDGDDDCNVEAAINELSSPAFIDELRLELQAVAKNFIDGVALVEPLVQATAWKSGGCRLGIGLANLARARRWRQQVKAYEERR